VAALAATTAMALIFVLVNLVASYAPDHVIPQITPSALPADRVSNSRIEIVDPYVLVAILSGLVAAALALAGVLTRRVAAHRRRPEAAKV
jgi:hypothetical protein